MSRLIELHGEQFGRLTVSGDPIHRKMANGKWYVFWPCRCACGGSVEVYGSNLRRGLSLSCGCFHRDIVTKHGLSKTAEHKLWIGMRQRCSNPRHIGYANYGGRGITVCGKWDSFNSFLADMGTKPSRFHTIERINNELGYSPENCRWATMNEQKNNTRKNIKLAFNGETLTLAEWSRRTSIPYMTIYNRFYRTNDAARILGASA